MSKNLYLGIMSGTSMDGVDIALCEIESDSCRLIAYDEYPFSASLKEEILGHISGVVTLESIGRLHIKLGELFAQKSLQFLHAHKIDAANVTAIGLHGQTLWHAPTAPHPFSMQLGDANTVVARTGITTITDFRGADVSEGGQGAPFAPAFHQFLFGSLGKNIGVLNIGGMANLTLLGDNLRGWDTGCGNVLLDMNVQNALGKNYDEDGAFARSGEVDEELLERLLADDYFAKEPPKSTGREYFNEAFLASRLPLFHTIDPANIQRTLLELTARTIAADLKRSGLEELILCGGGAKNSFLMERLAALSGVNLKRSEAYGVPSEALEAMAFAWLAYKRLHHEEVALASVTGAKKNRVLGAIYG